MTLVMPDLHVLVSWRNRNNEYVVKTSLLLPGRTLQASDHSAVAHAAFEQCVRNLMRELEDYKDRLNRMPERQAVQRRHARVMSMLHTLPPRAQQAILHTLGPEEQVAAAAGDPGELPGGEPTRQRQARPSGGPGATATAGLSRHRWARVRPARTDRADAGLPP